MGFKVFTKYFQNSFVKDLWGLKRGVYLQPLIARHGFRISKVH
jgi:hypothetical protein